MTVTHWRLCAIAGLMVASAGVHAEVYRPNVQGNGLDSLQETDVQRGMFGAGFANTLTTNNDSQPSMMFSLRHFGGEKWYLLGELQMGLFSTRAVFQDGEEVRSDDEELLRFSFGAGYALLQGTASTSGVRVLPWSLAVEATVGEQYSGDTSGQYGSVGMSVQFHGERVWTSLGVREFLLTDERLAGIDSDAGTQWDISLGLWY